jgi:hypothetical protein
MHRIRRRLTYANVMSTIAVFVAIAGGSTAIAVTVSASKKSDINKKGNIRAGRVTSTKLADGAVTSGKLGAINVVQATGTNFATATCAAGHRLLGGGADIPGGAGAALQTSRPQGNSWNASVNAGTGFHGVTVYALCLNG